MLPPVYIPSQKSNLAANTQRNNIIPQETLALRNTIRIFIAVHKGNHTSWLAHKHKMHIYKNTFT